MSYIDVVICIEPDRFLETWPPIYRGQERPIRDRLRVSQVDHHVYSRYTACLTDFTFEFIRRPIPPILSLSSRTFVELTLVTMPDSTKYSWDFYFRALGSLVVLSFPQLLSFSSVLPKPLSKTLTRSSNRRNPVQLTVPC
jgi:hypothetical protein